MSTFSRFTDIINSNINAILEKADDPEKMIKLLLAEMQETLVEVRAASARSIAEQKQARHRAAAARRETVEWESRAELAIERSRDDLARAAIAERGRAEERAIEAEGDVAALDDAIARQQEDTKALEEKLAAARSREQSLMLRGRTASSRPKVRRQLDGGSYNDAFDKFAEYERRLDEMEGAVEAYDLTGRSLVEEIESMEANDAIEDELNRRKAKVEGFTVVQGSRLPGPPTSGTTAPTSLKPDVKGVEHEPGER